MSACLVSASLMEEKSVSAIPRVVTNDWCISWLGRVIPVIPNLKDRGIASLEIMERPQKVMFTVACLGKNGSVGWDFYFFL